MARTMVEMALEDAIERIEEAKSLVEVILCTYGMDGCRADYQAITGALIILMRHLDASADALKREEKYEPPGKSGRLS